MRRRGFTLVELMVVIALAAVLLTLLVVSYRGYRARARLSRIGGELTEVANAVTQYAEDNDYQYPPDTGRSVPPGLEKYLAGGTWPESLWPHGAFDWDNWLISGQRTYQVTYRLCGLDDPIEYCSDPELFPTFNRQSGIFYCIAGNCVPHESDTTAPAYCVNCNPKKRNY